MEDVIWTLGVSVLVGHFHVKVDVLVHPHVPWTQDAESCSALLRWL